MKKVYQTTFGKQGNCWPACLASIFEETIEEWECCACHREDWREQTAKKLEEKGLQHNEVSVSAQDKDGAPLQVKGISLNDKHLYLIGVTSKNSLPHVVIGEYDEAGSLESKHLKFNVVHDPLGDDNASNIISCECVVIFGAKHV